jgi:hypothetical protein
MQRNNNQRERKGSRGANIVYPIIIHAEVCPGILELMEKGKLGQKKQRDMQSSTSLIREGIQKQVPAGRLVA